MKFYLSIFSSLLFSSFLWAQVLPPSVIEFQEVKDKDSIEFEIASYKAATDLKNLAKSQLSSGNASLALKYITLGAQLFPYRGDVVSLKNDIIGVYIAKTNELIVMPEKDCSYIEDRVEYLKTISPDNLTRIKGYKEHCHKTLSSSDQKAMKFTESNFKSLDVPQEKYHSKAMEKIEATIAQNTFDTYPAMEQLILSMNYLGDISMVTKSVSYPEDLSSWSNLTLYHKYVVFWGNYNWSYGKFCENVAAIFSAYPSGKKTSTKCSPQHFHQVSGVSTQKDVEGYYVKDLNNKGRYMGYQGQAFNSSFLPQFLIFDEYEVVDSKKSKVGSHVFTLNPGDPTAWLLFSSFEKEKGNIYLGDYAHINFPFKVSHPRFEFKENFVMVEKKAKRASLDNKVGHEFYFNKAKTFKAYVQVIESLDKKKPIDIYQVMKRL